VNKEKENAQRRRRRRYSVRNRLRGDAQRPRMSVFRSHRNLGCQLIDDTAGRTLVSVSTRDKDVRENVKFGGNCDAAKMIGQLIAQRALEAGIQMVRFDRGCYKYHGRVAAVADAAREAGLKL
jgi:large subunit ribosomal protein L18